jgi:hypothetical protein
MREAEEVEFFEEVEDRDVIEVDLGHVSVLVEAG